MTVIAMTRQLGCLGTDAAKGIADRLGLRIIHSEIVAHPVAGRLGVEEGTVLRYLDGSALLFERLAINKRKLCQYTTEEILSIAQQGRVLTGPAFAPSRAGGAPIHSNWISIE